MKRWLVAAWIGALLIAPAARAAEKKPADDKRSVAELVQALAGRLPGQRQRASKALAARGPKVLPVVLDALKGKDWRVRRGATDALAAMGQDANSAVPGLVGALKDRDAWVRDGAASALGKMGTLPAPAARALAKAVTDPDPWVRESALDALRRGTKDESILLPAAVAAARIHHSGWNVRRYAMDILWRHGRQHKAAVPALLAMLEHPSEGMWDCSPRAVEMLAGLGAGKKAVPILVTWLTSKNRGVPRKAAASLAKLGKDAASAVPALRKMAEKDPDKGNRAAARKALEQIQGEKKG